MDINEFVNNPWEEDTVFWNDSASGELVTRCPTCGAEARHTEQQLTDFCFRHTSECPVGLRVVSGEA